MDEPDEGRPVSRQDLTNIKPAASPAEILTASGTSESALLKPLPESHELSNPESTGDTPSDSEKPWGAWLTIGWLVIAGIVISTIQAVILVGYSLLSHGSDPEAVIGVAEGAYGNGFLLALTTCLTALPTVGILALIAMLRWPGRVRQYLALLPVPVSTYLIWIGATLALAAATDTLTILLGRPVVPEFSRDMYVTAGSLVLLWLALVVAAPVVEEITFRGFMFRGLAASRLGVVGAIVLTSLVWAIIHLQYDFYGILSIFVVGLLLGWARFKTGSTYVTIVMHMTMNIIATIETAIAHNMGDRFPF